MLSNSTCCFVGFQTISGVLDWVNKEVYLEPCQTSEMEPFVKIVRRFHSFTIFAESSFLDLGQGSEHAIEINLKSSDGHVQWVSSKVQKCLKNIPIISELFRNP